MGLSLAIDNGVVSAFYFIFLDIILLTCLDDTLSRLLSHYYYREIYDGNPLWLHSGDIPGVTNFIVGRRLSLLNIAALATKAFFIGMVFLLDLNIFAEPSNPSVQLLSTFALDSPMIPKNGTDFFYNEVFQPWERTVSCYRLSRVTAPAKNSITFYHVAFNLTNGNEYLQDDVRPLPTSVGNIIFINHTTMTCLSPNNVRESKPLVSVFGCSSLGRDSDSNCNRPANVKRTAPFMRPGIRRKKEQYILYVYGYPYSAIEYRAHEFKTTFPEYVGNGKNTTLHCFRNSYRLGRQLKTWCLLKMIENGTTLFERWDYDWKNETLKRVFPGPVFDTVLDLQLNRLIYYGHDARPDSNWLDLSRKIVYHAMVYKFEKKTLTILNKGSTRTVIPTYCVLIFVIFTVAIVLVHLLVRQFVVSHHPRLNSIDGISSIGREESKPSGKSLVRGSTMILGFSKIEDTVIHLGPLRSFESAEKMAMESEIV